MVRNWEIIREILLKLEKMSPDKTLRLGDFPEEKAYDYSYHVELLFEAGLIYGEMLKELGTQASDFLALRLTWAGHEFLDSIRSDTVWDKTKSRFVKEGISMTFDLIKSVAIGIAASLLKQ